MGILECFGRGRKVVEIGSCLGVLGDGIGEQQGVKGRDIARGGIVGQRVELLFAVLLHVIDGMARSLVVVIDKEEETVLIGADAMQEEVLGFAGIFEGVADVHSA